MSLKNLTTLIPTLQTQNNSSPQDTSLVGGFIHETNSFSDTVLNFEVKYSYNLNLYTYHLVYHSDPYQLIPLHVNIYDDVWERIIASNS